MKEKIILKTISILNEEEDAFLIFMLNDKLKKNKEIELDMSSVSSRNIQTTKRGIRIALNRKIPSLNKKYIRAKKILENNNCDECSYSSPYPSKEDFSFFHSTSGNKICISCSIRCNRLEDFICEIEKETEKKIEIMIENNPNLILLKSLINKITQKNNKIKYKQ